MEDVQIFACGARLCKDGKEHDDLGPTITSVSGCAFCVGEEAPDPNCRRCKGDPEWSYISGESASCSRCGMSAMDQALFGGV